MKKKTIFFQWGLKTRKTDYSYVIMTAAIEKNYMRSYAGPLFLYRDRWRKVHDKICREYPVGAPLFYPFYLPRNMKDNRNSMFLFNEHHPCLLNLGFIKWLKRKYNGKAVLVVRNMIKNKRHPAIHGIHLEQLKEAFDLIVTDEKKDAELYGLFFMPDSFSQIYKRKVKVKYDLCFIGADKERAELLNEIAQKADEHGVTYNIKIIGKRKKNTLLEYTDYQPYSKILKQDLQANCILEVLQPGQESYTLRLQEAICLGKKLLTNNPNVKSEKYYNPKYIQIFEHTEDIDWDFVKEKTEPDYGYEGDYSPITFLETIELELEKRNKENC